MEGDRLCDWPVPAIGVVLNATYQNSYVCLPFSPITYFHCLYFPSTLACSHRPQARELESAGCSHFLWTGAAVDRTAMDDREESERREGERAWTGARQNPATDRWPGDVRVPESVVDADPSLPQSSPQLGLAESPHPCPAAHIAPPQVPLSPSSSRPSSPSALNITRSDTPPDVALDREQRPVHDAGCPSNADSTSTASASHILSLSNSGSLAPTPPTSTSSSNTLAHNTPSYSQSTAAPRSNPALPYSTMSASSSARTLDTPDALDTPGDDDGRIFDPMQTYGPLLQCAACDPPSLYVAPITLHCGHTVCARHVRTDPADEPPPPSPPTPSPSALSRLLPAVIRARQSATTSTAGAGASAADPSSNPVVPTCPIPICRQLTRPSVPQINIPPESTVAYYPPIVNTPTNTDPPARITIANPRVDVSVGRVLALLDRAERENVAEEDEGRGTRAPVDGDTDGEDSVEEGEENTTPTVNPSSLPSSSSGAGPSNIRRPHRSNHDRPRKRQRRGEPSNVQSHPDRLNDTPDERRRPWCSRQEEHTERFNKELVESLTCEICFMLLYQPVTTPCQHVRAFL